MSDIEADVAKKVAGLLRLLADKIEVHPEMLKDTGLVEKEMPSIEPRRKSEEAHSDYDISRIFAEGGETALREKLETIDITALKGIIRLHGFDPGKLAEKWRKKDRLVSLIIERVAARNEKGRVFEKYP